MVVLEAPQIERTKPYRIVSKFKEKCKKILWKNTVEFYILDVETKSYFRKRMVQYEMDQETVFFHFFMFVFGCCIYALARVWRLSGCIKKMSVQQMGAQIQAKEDYTTLDQLPKGLYSMQYWR